MIPEELRKLRQWTYSLSKKELKRPTYTKYEPNDALTYERAKILAGDERYIGMYVTHDDPYILIDIDHVDPTEPENQLPPKFLQLFLENRTYSEISPSGKGIRAIYKLPKIADKTLVQGNTFYSSELSKKRLIQVSFGPPWCTITGNQLSFATEKIGTITLDQLAEAFTIKFKVFDIQDKSKKTTFNTIELPELGQVRRALFQIPLDQNPRVVRAYETVTGGTYEHYAFWLKILMALHNYAKKADCLPQCLDLAIAWSATDPNDYEGEEPVLNKWRSFDESKDETVTFLTLFKIANKCRIFWPYPKARKKETDPLLPIHNQYANFKALLDFYNLKFYRNASNTYHLYVTGDEDIVDKWFKTDVIFEKYYGPFDTKQLSNIFLLMMQEEGYVGVSAQVSSLFSKIVLQQTEEEVNFFKMYLDTPFDELPEDMQDGDPSFYKLSTFEALWGCIKPSKEDPLHKILFKKWMFGLLRELYYDGPFRTNSGALLLTGPENTYKTSFFKYLLPPFFRSEVVCTTHGFGSAAELRDVTKIAASSRIVVFDEIEQHFKGVETEAYFKKLLDNDPQTFIDKYEVSPQTVEPKAIYGATSNHDTFKLQSRTMRRLFHIPIRIIDTETELRLCWHRILNELKDEFQKGLLNGQKPWLLDRAHTDRLVIKNVQIKAETNLELYLKEVWDFEAEFELEGVTSFQQDGIKRLLTERQIREVLDEMYPRINASPLAIRHALQNLCAEYTRTVSKRVHWPRPKFYIEDGLGIQSQFKRWVMPPFSKKVIQDYWYLIKRI